MDPVLARMFDLDRPIAIRMAERDLQEDFVKSASQIGLDLTKLTDDEVDQLWRYHKGYRALQAEAMAKEAAWVKMGRSLAHQCVDQMLYQLLVKQAQLDPTNIPVGHLQALLNEPSLTPRFVANPQQVIDMVAAGLPADQAREWVTANFGNQPMEKILHRRINETWRNVGSKAYMDKYIKGPPMTPISRQALIRQLQLEGLGVPPPAPTGFWAKYGPSGLMKAIFEGNWGVALRKGLPVAGLGIGALALMRRRAEQERERQLALGSLASSPGTVPMATYPRLEPGATG